MNWVGFNTLISREVGRFFSVYRQTVLPGLISSALYILIFGFTLEQRISEIDGIECEPPGGAFYLFVRITDESLSSDDKKFVLQLLEEKHVLVVHGSGFSPEYGRGHFRMVCLPTIEILYEAFNRISDFLGG